MCWIGWQGERHLAFLAGGPLGKRACRLPRSWLHRSELLNLARHRCPTLLLAKPAVHRPCARHCEHLRPRNDPSSPTSLPPLPCCAGSCRPSSSCLSPATAWCWRRHATATPPGSSSWRSPCRWRTRHVWGGRGRASCSSCTCSLHGLQGSAHCEQLPTCQGNSVDGAPLLCCCESQHAATNSAAGWSPPT